jgi:hypothetical protein
VWRDIVTTGVGRYGYTIDEETMNEVSAQLKQMESAMPLVQFALAKLWERRDRLARTVPRAVLDAIGGITGALEMHAEELVAKLSAQYGAAALFALERATMVLTTPQGTRLQVHESILFERVGVPIARPIVQALEAARLVVREGSMVFFAHDAVIGGWRRLASWIHRARADREIAAELELQAARWASSPARELLWTKGQLAAARAVDARGVTGLSGQAQEFLRAARFSEIRRTVAGVALVFVVLAGVGLAIGLFISSRQRQQDNRAEFMRVQADIQNHRIYAIEELQATLTRVSQENKASQLAKKEVDGRYEALRQQAEAEHAEAARAEAKLQQQRLAAITALQRCQRARAE